MGEIQKIEIDTKQPNIIEIDGVKYILEKEKTKKIDNVEHSDRVIFKKFDEQEYLKNLKIVVKALSEKTSTQEILTEILKPLDMKTLRRLVKRIESGKPIKKHKGCLGFKVGDAYIQLME